MTDTITPPVVEEKARKPLYKRWWVYAMAAVVLIGIANAGGGSPEASLETTSSGLNDSAIETEAPAPTVPAPAAPASEFTRSEENAIASAENYIDLMAFSRTGLIEQLEFEGFTTAEATLAVDSITVDWNEQAWKSAETYLDTMPFSKSELIDQLEFEGFTNAQATYGVGKTGL